MAPAQPFDHLAGRVLGRGMLHVADVLAQGHASMAGERHRVLQVGPPWRDNFRHHPRRIPSGCRLSPRARRRPAPIPARPPPPPVVHAIDDAAVVEDQQIAPFVRDLPRFAVGGRHGLAAAIGAGQDHGPRKSREEELVDGRMGQHDAQLPKPRRDPFHSVRRRMDVEKHDRTLAPPSTGLPPRDRRGRSPAPNPDRVP